MNADFSVCGMLLRQFILNKAVIDVLSEGLKFKLSTGSFNP